MEVSGRVKKIFDEQTFNSGFKKRELILTTQEQYPQHLSIEFLQEKVELLNPLNEGDEIKISINLRGREWTNPEGVTKYFNSISGWRVEKIQQESLAGYEETPPIPPITDSKPYDSSTTEEDDDLPF